MSHFGPGATFAMLPTREFPHACGVLASHHRMLCIGFGLKRLPVAALIADCRESTNLRPPRGATVDLS